MKTIVLKQHEQERLSTRELIRSSLNNPPEKGFTVTEMAGRLKILNKLNQASGTLSLEDADFATLKACADQVHWALMDQSIVDFYEDLKKTGEKTE